MVKYIPTKRANKKVTREEVLKPKEEKTIRHYHLEQTIERRHRFKTTKELRSLIDINLSRRIEDIHIDQRTDATGSYFKDIMEVKRTAMAGPAERRYLKEAYLLSQSLPQVLLNLPHLLQLSYSFFSDISCNQLVLELLVYLLKDCREEAYPHLYELLAQLAKHLDIEQVEHLEKSFLLFAYAVKYLEKQILNDFDRFANAVNDLFFSHKHQAVRKLAGEAMGYLFRKKRQLLAIFHMQQDHIYTNKSIAYAIFSSVQALSVYLSNNSPKWIDLLWGREQPQIILEFYKFCIETVSEQPKNQVWSLLELCRDLQHRKQSELLQQILIELYTYKLGIKVTPPIMELTLPLAETPELVGHMLKLGFLVDVLEPPILKCNDFIRKLIKEKSLGQLQIIVDILLQRVCQKPGLQKLVIASVLQQLFNFQLGALDLLIKLDPLNCNEKLIPEQLSEFCESDFFQELLNTNQANLILGLCKLSSLVQMPPPVKEVIQNKLLSYFIMLNNSPCEELREKRELNELARQLPRDSEVELIEAEQDQKCRSYRDGIQIRILEQLEDLTELCAKFNARSIAEVFQTSNLQPMHFIRLLPQVSQHLLEAGLMSRKREVRLICAQKLVETQDCEALKLIIMIDQQRCDLDNERLIKSHLVNLKAQASKAQEWEQRQIFRFALGFAFTRFNLVKPLTRDLLSQLLPRHDYLKVFLLQENAQFEQKELDCFEKFCYMQQEDEQQDASKVFDDVLAPALLQAEFKEKDQKILYDIAIKQLTEQMNREKSCEDPQDYFKRRYGDKKSLFYLRLLSSIIKAQHEGTLRTLFLYYLIKDDEATQNVALNNLQVLELQICSKDSHSLLVDQFTSLKNLVDGKTFRSETVKFSFEVPENLVPRFKQYAVHALYPKLFSKFKLKQKFNKTSAIVVRRNAVLEMLSRFDVDDYFFELLEETHGIREASVPISIKIQYFKIMKNLIEKFGFQIPLHLVEKQIELLLSTLAEAFQLKQESQGSYVKELWKVAIKRISQIVVKYQNEPLYVETISKLLNKALQMEALQQAFVRIVEDSKYQASGALRLLTQLAEAESYWSVLKSNHELLLSRFYQLYKMTMFTNARYEEEDGRIAFEVKKQAELRIGKQRNVLQYLNSIMYSIFGLDGNLSDVRMELEMSELAQLVCDQYGEKALDCIFFYLQENCKEGSSYIVMRDQKCLYLFHCLLCNLKALDQDNLNKYIDVFLDAVINPNIYDSAIPRQNLNGTLINHCLKALLSKVQSISVELIEKLFTQYSVLLVRVSNVETRNLIVDVILKMVDQFKDFYPVNIEGILLLKGMNARDKISEEIDPDKALEACIQAQKFVQEAQPELADLRAVHLIMQSSFYLVSSNELSIRIAVQEIFKAYFQKSSSTYLDDYLLPQLIQKMNTNSESTIKCCFYIFEQHLTFLKVDPAVEQLLNGEPLNSTDLNFKTRFAEFKALMWNEEPDSNLFNLLFDIQLPKRIKGMQILEKKLPSLPPFLIDSYAQILIPLLDFNIFGKAIDITSQKYQLTDTVRSHYTTLQQISISIYSYLSNLFEFERRIKLLSSMTKKLEKQMMLTNKHTLMIQALAKTIAGIAKNKDPNYDVVAIVKERLQQEKTSQLQDFLNSYFYEEVEQQEEITDFEFSYKNLVQQEKELAKARELEQKDISSQIWNQVIDVTVNEIQSWQKRSGVLLTQVYNPLKNLFILSSRDKDDKNKVFLSNALIEIITQLPPDTFMTELNRLVGRLVRGLKSRDNDFREESRRSLLELSKRIGTTFLKFILLQLKSMLNQGFENHVLSYTVGLLVEQAEGSIDNCIEEIVSVFMDEVFGQVSSEKEEDNLPKKTKEIKSKKGAQNFRTIGKMIDFVNTLPKMIGVMDNFLSKLTLSHQLTSKLKLIFEHLFLGLIENSSVPENPIPVLYLMIAETSHKVAEQLNKQYHVDFTLDLRLNRQSKVKKEDIMTVQLPSFGNNSIIQYMKENKLKTTSVHIFSQTTLLSIKILHSHIKRSTLEDSPLLQKIFKVVLDCLEYQEMVTECVAVICQLIRGYKWVSTFKKSILTSAMQSVAKLTSTDEQAVRDAFTFLKAVLETRIGEFTPGQQKTLVHFIDLYLENQEPLECLRLVVAQQWPIPQIFDLVLRVRDNMLTNQKKYQNVCKQIYLLFLIKYPLQAPVIQQHYNFLLANVNYKYPAGRSAVYSCLQSIFENFPQESINKMADIAYFTLVASFVKEDELKPQLDELLGTILGRVPTDKAQQYVNNALTWMLSAKVNVSISGIESLRVLKRYLSASSIPLASKCVKVLEECSVDWKEWRENIQARNIQQKNLKNSQWANELEPIKVDENPSQALRLESFLNLLLSFDAPLLVQFYEQEVLCQLLDCVRYPKQECANAVMKLLLNSRHMSIFQNTLLTQRELLETKLFNLVKYQFLIKYVRNGIIIGSDQLYTFVSEFIIHFNKIGLQSINQALFDAFVKLTSNLMARESKLGSAIQNLLGFYKHYLQQPQKVLFEQIVASLVKLQALQNEHQEIEQLLKSLEKAYGANEFLRIYSNAKSSLEQKKRKRKVELQEKAVKDPEAYYQIKQRSSMKKKLLKKVKLRKKRGKLPVNS